MQSDVVVAKPTANAGLLLRGVGVLTAALAGIALATSIGSPRPVGVPQAPLGRAVSPVAALSSLPLAAQGPVSAALGHADRAYWFHGLQAANPVNRLGIRFAAGAVTVASGRGHVRFSLPGPATPHSSANRMTYDRGGLTQTYANGPLGLEQSFVLAHGPARLAIGMKLSGNLRASLAGGTVLLTGAGTTLRYGGLIATDARGRRLPATIRLRGDRLILSVDARDAVYPVRVDPFVASGNLNEATPPGDAFGYSSAVSGSTIAVGAPAHQVGGNTSQGAVFAFTKPSTGWASSTTSKMLTASDGAADDALGFTVATNGTTIVSGASGKSAAYVFVQHSGAWASTQAAELPIPAGLETYIPVAISPDGKTIAVGGENATVGGHVQQGEALAFTEPGGGWGTATPAVATLTASDGVASDLFGLEVAASDNAIAVIGGNTGGGSGSTAVYVFTKTTAWATGTQTGELQDGGAGEAGSGSLAISPDGKTIAVGTAIGNAGKGEAFVFAEPGSSWHDESVPNATLTSSDGAVGDSFGFAVGAADDAVVVSAPDHAVGGTVSIAGIYVYDEPMGGWSGDPTLTQTQELNPATTVAGEAGYSLGFDGATIVAGTRDHQQGAWVFTTTTPGGTTTGGATAPPVDTVVPGVGGTAKAGSTLSCSKGTWTNSPTGYGYQWSRDGTPIAGATSVSYKVQTDDEGLKITCTVTAANAKGKGKPATSKAVAIPVPKRKGCPAATGSVSGTDVGIARLGMTRAQADHAYTHSSTRGSKDKDFFCLTPHGVRVGYASPKLVAALSRSAQKSLKGHVVWISTDNARYAVHGIRAGATLAAAQHALPHSYYFRLGLNNWYLAPAGKATAVLKLRHGLVEEIGIADKQLTGSHKADRTLMGSFD
jgi:hypothetical protein